MSTYGSEFRSTGVGLPDRIVPNSEFEKYLDTSDQWIRERTGIETRRLIEPERGESTLTLSLQAAKSALQKADLRADALGMIVVGTITPDSVMPCTANQLQVLLGASRAFTFDLQAACSGFLYGLAIADQFIRNGLVEHALAIGAETLSTITNWRDRGTCVLFGDAAGAAILSKTTDPNRRVIATKLFSDGRYGEHLYIAHGYGKVPPHAAEFSMLKSKVVMHGAEIFKLGVRAMVDSCEQILNENNFTTKDVDFFLFHQANIRIVYKCMEMLGVPEEKTWINVQKYGNTSSATLPIALEEAWQAGRVKRGSLVLMTTVGGGLTWASSLIRL